MKKSPYISIALVLLAVVFTSPACSVNNAASPPSFANTATPTATSISIQSEPTSAVATPSQTAAPPPDLSWTPVALPPLPQMSMVYEGRRYPGFQWEYTWPTVSLPGRIGLTQSDAILPNPSYAVSISSGDTLDLEITAHEPPETLEAQVWTSIPDSPVKTITLEAGFTAPISFDLPEGAYIVTVPGKWSNATGTDVSIAGNITYVFKIEVK
jgi:hypothetical protein